MFPKWIAKKVNPSSARLARRAARKRPELLVEMLEERSLFAVSLAGGTSPEQFVTSLYVDLLHRQPQAAEIESWALALDNGANPSQVAHAFVDSAEYVSDEVTQAYQQYLQRNPEPAALSSWGSQFQSGLSYQGFLANILSSSEYSSDHGGTKAALVSALYSQVLGRTPDAAGLAGWMNAINAGVSSVQIAGAFIVSPEAENNVLISDYQKLLGRNPSAGESAYWNSQLGGGLSTEELTTLIAGSPEFQADQNAVIPPSYASSGQIPGTFGVNLVATSFSTTSTPTVSLDVNPLSFSGMAFIDVDLKHDGSFNDAGDMGQTSGSISPQDHQLTLDSLPNGSYSVRARVIGSTGQVITSPTISITVDTNAGFIGSSNLNGLFSDFANDIAATGSIPSNFYAAHPQNYLFGGVGINVHVTQAGDLQNLAADLQNLGMQGFQIYAAQDMVIGYLPIWQIPRLATLPNFGSVTPITKAIASTGSAESQGDAVINGPEFRADTGTNGSGETVGVLSDSANTFEGGLGQSFATGDLIPGHVADLADFPVGSSGVNDEGRAMMEIIADVAPGSNQDFFTGFVSPQGMAEGITAMATGVMPEVPPGIVPGLPPGATFTPASVIVDDIGYGDEPMFNDGVIAQAADAAHNMGVFYASASGNDGPVGFTTAWNSVSANVAGQAGTYLNFGNSIYQLVTIPPGNEFFPDVQWDNAFLEGGATSNPSDPNFNANFQVQTQVNVLFLNGTATQLIGEMNDDTLNTNEAVQDGAGVVNTTDNNITIAMAFQLAQGPAPTRLRWVNDTDGSGIAVIAQGQGGSTIFGHAAAAGVVSVAAAPWNLPNTTEPFSDSGGPISILFDDQGNRLATPDVRQKPDITGPDGVDTSFAFDFPPPTGDPDQHYRFYGTSAATPHVGAAAADLLSAYGKTTPSKLLEYMESTAIDVDGPVPNVSAGAGMVYLTPENNTAGGIPFNGGQTSNVATQLGVLSGSVKYAGAIENLPNGLPSNQWGEWTAGKTGTFTADLDYGISNGDLNMRLYTLDSAGDLIQLASATNIGVLSQTLTAPVTAGEPLLIWIYGYNHAQSKFGLTVSVS